MKRQLRVVVVICCGANEIIVDEDVPQPLIAVISTATLCVISIKVADNDSVALSVRLPVVNGIHRFEFRSCMDPSVTSTSRGVTQSGKTPKRAKEGMTTRKRTLAWSECVRTLCANLLQDHFGPVTAAVTVYLMNRQYMSLPLLAYRCHLPINQVKAVLRNLIQHHMISYRSDDANKLEYTCIVDRILQLAYYPHYLNIVELAYGDIGQRIVRKILHHGMISLSQCIDRILKNQLEDEEQQENIIGPDDIAAKFTELVNAHYVCRCDNVRAFEGGSENTVPKFSPFSDPFLVPEASDRNGFTGNVSPSRKRTIISSATGTVSKGDSGVMWRINFDKFSRQLRNSFILKMVKSYYCQVRYGFAKCIEYVAE
ncbi:unnamed protein product [Soboliphyme baturini]|uniref:DNA-directed RNA polymerase III subunit RPC3 n=1 Tax=Soboliphyme baturini TaxID=241478 RepID=A0A183INR5_9BILA|nr:unnamed protein product [Soboliphyme baturini]